MDEYTSMPAIEMDLRLEAANERLRQETLVIEARNQELEQLIRKKEALIARWEDALTAFRAERHALDSEIARLFPK